MVAGTARTVNAPQSPLPTMVAEIERLWQQAEHELCGHNPVWALPKSDRRHINRIAHQLAPRAWQSFRLLLALRYIVARQARPQLRVAEFLACQHIE